MTETCRENPDEIKQVLRDCVDQILDATTLLDLVDDSPKSAHAHAAFCEALSYLRVVSERLTRLAQ